MGRRSGSAARTPAAPVPGCVDCGACCFSPEADYIRVFGVDLARMDEAALRLTEEIDARRSMRMGGGRCVALVIDPALRTFKCAIYEARPDVCRSLERGSGDCHEQRAAKVDPPLLAVAALLRRSAP